VFLGPTGLGGRLQLAEFRDRSMSGGTCPHRIVEQHAAAAGEILLAAAQPERVIGVVGACRPRRKPITDAYSLDEVFLYGLCDPQRGLVRSRLDAVLELIFEMEGRSNAYHRVRFVGGERTGCNDVVHDQSQRRLDVVAQRTQVVATDRGS
jgi:hypothetical protein